MRRQIPLLALAIGAGLTLASPTWRRRRPALRFEDSRPDTVADANRNGEISKRSRREQDVPQRVDLVRADDGQLNEPRHADPVFGAGVEKVRLIGSTLFINANSAAFSLDFNVSNSTLTNEWVRVPASNPNYANISAAILLPS